MVASVVFKGNLAGKNYNYRVNGFKVSPMDQVLVPVGDYGHIEVATVVAVWVDELDVVYGGCDVKLKDIIAFAERDALITQMDAEIASIEAKYTKLLSKLG